MNRPPSRATLAVIRATITSLGRRIGRIGMEWLGSTIQRQPWKDVLGRAGSCSQLPFDAESNAMSC